MRESTIEKRVTQYAQRCGWYAIKLNGAGHRGLPDRLYLKSGQVQFIEFKAPGQQATKLQQSIHQKLKELGFSVYVIDNIDNGKQLFTS